MALHKGNKEIFTVTRVAEETITKYALVKKGSADNSAILTDAQGEKADGIAMESVVSGDPLRVLIIGRCPVIITTASGLGVGANLTPSATTDDGKAEIADSGDYIFGRADDAPAADDDQVLAIVNFTIQPILA